MRPFPVSPGPRSGIQPIRAEMSPAASRSSVTNSATRSSGNRKLAPEMLTDPQISPCRLRTGAASAVNPTSSSSRATAYPSRWSVLSWAINVSRSVTVRSVKAVSSPTSAATSGSDRSDSRALPFEVACRGMCWPTQL